MKPSAVPWVSVIQQAYNSRKALFALLVTPPVLLMYQSCSRNPSAEEELSAWEKWAESSASGLWIDSEERIVTYAAYQILPSQMEAQPAFFDPRDLAVKGDSIFVTDRGQQRLVCLDAQGRVLWTFGEPGEGPGTFSAIMGVAVFGDKIAISDILLGRVDIITSAGSYLSSLSVQTPQDLITISDTSFAVLSSNDQRGNVLVFSSSGLIETLHLDTWDADDFACLTGVGDSGRLAVFSTVGDRFAIVDLRLQEYCEHSLRSFPVEYPRPEPVQSVQGENAMRFVPFIGNVFVGAFGELDVRLGPLTSTKEFWLFDSTKVASFTVIDRYSWDGDYLDSYLIPLGRSGSMMHSSLLGILALNADDATLVFLRTD